MAPSYSWEAMNKIDKQIIEKVKADPRYIANVQHGKPRSGHPEGTVAAHIIELNENLETLYLNYPDNENPLTEEEYWKLRFLIETHDTFKADAIPNSPILDPKSHASLAKKFASEYISHGDILNMIQFHDESFALWKQWSKTGFYNKSRFDKLVHTIKDWRLFLLFIIVDGCTKGKGNTVSKWFIQQVKEKVDTDIDESWLIEHDTN